STTYGATQPRENLASLWYTRRILTQRPHVAEQYAEIAESVIGAQRPVPDAVFPCDAGAEQAVSHRLHDAGQRHLVILNPGAGWGAKQWPAERYGLVAQALAQRGIQSIINYGPREESLALRAEKPSHGSPPAQGVSVGDAR